MSTANPFNFSVRPDPDRPQQFVIGEFNYRDRFVTHRHGFTTFSEARAEIEELQKASLMDRDVEDE